MQHGPHLHENFLLSHLKPGKQIIGYDVALKGKKEIAERTFEFIFEKPKDFHFQAGQHVRMTLIDPPETDNKGNRRFLTLGCTPQDQDLAVAMRMTGTAFKRSLEQMKVGEKVRIEMMTHSHEGAFVLHGDSSKPAVFLCGGIGIVPAFAIIKDALQQKLPHKMTLFYSNRRPEDAPYLEELQYLAKENRNFKLIATMTEMNRSTQKWEGETWQIDAAMLKKYVPDLQAPIYYIAGLTDMVNAMKKLLNDLGIKEDRIRAEDFSGMKMQVMARMPGTWRNYLLPIVIGVMILLFILVHAGAAVSMYNIFTLQGISYVTIGIILVIIALKVLAIVKLKHHFSKKVKD